MSLDRLGDVFPDALPTSFGAYRIGHALRAAWPQFALVEGTSTTFDFDGFTEAGHCTRTPCAGPHLEVHTRWNAPFFAEINEDNSFAYLKELCLSAVLRWMKTRPESLFPLLESQLEVLRAQMRSEGTVVAAPPPQR